VADDSFADVLAQANSYKKTWNNIMSLETCLTRKSDGKMRVFCGVLWSRSEKIDVVVCLFGYKVYVEGGNANVIDNFHWKHDGDVNAGICEGRGWRVKMTCKPE